MAENSRWAAIIETIGDAVLMTVGLGYLTKHARQAGVAGQSGAPGATITAPAKSPFDVGPIGGLTMQDEINYQMVFTKWQSEADAQGTQRIQAMLDEIGTFGIGQRKAIKMRIAGQFSDIVKEALRSKTSRTLTQAEIARVMSDLKAAIPPGTTIDQVQLDAALKAMQIELGNMPLEEIDQALHKVIDDTMEPMLRWHQEKTLKANLIAMDYIPEFDGEQWFRDWVKGQKDTIQDQWAAWSEVYGDPTGKPLSAKGQEIQKKLEGGKAGAEAEDILRPIGREIKSLDSSEYGPLNQEIERIKAITDPAARLQEAQQFKTNYETNHKANADAAKERMRQEHETRKRNAGWNPFRRR